MRLPFLTAALCLSSSAFAQEEGDAESGYFIQNAWADPATCNLEDAAPVSFAQLASGDGGLTGACVVIDGYQMDRALFADLRDARSRRAATAESLSRRRVGLYADWTKVGNPPDEPERVRVVGEAGRCETQWPEALMVMGYCHYTGGPILIVSEIYESGSF